MVHYRLTYFNGRGLGEICRQIFIVAGQDFEDRRLQFGSDEWEAFRKETPFGRLPMLEVDGKKLAQSYAMARFLARKFGLAGKTNWEAAQVDALSDQFKDFDAEIRKFMQLIEGTHTGDEKKLRAELFEPALKKHLPIFSRAVKESGSGFLVGDSLAFVDLDLAEFISFLLSHDLYTFEDYPELKSLEEKVHAIPVLKKWRDTRPVTPW